MKGKLLLLTGAAAGYVLGTRAGRERYEQLKERATTLWHDPEVREKVNQAQEAVREKAPEVQHTLSDAASAVADKAKSTFTKDDDEDVPEVTSNGSTGTASTKR